MVDTSALIAILLREPEMPAFVRAIIASRDARVGAPTALEFLMVATGNRRLADEQQVAEVLGIQQLAVVDWTAGHAEQAGQAFRRYGKGRHPAKLNFGDCMSYALAKSLGAPLLYKGDDFARTDIVSAV